jgi:hypothetical protein
MEKIKYNCIKMQCIHCSRAANRGQMRYVCEQGHRHPVHKSCREVYQECPDCNKKIIATEVGNNMSPTRARANYRAFHTRTLKPTFVGGKDDEVVGHKLEKLKLAYEHLHFSFHCISYFKRPEVEQHVYDEAKTRIRAECNAKWQEERKRIALWFST